MRPTAAGRHNPGFVLVMVLVVLALAGGLLGLCAHRTSRRALAAGLARRDLQRRWGRRSLETVCLARAEALLRRPALNGKGPVAVVRRSIALGGLTLDLVVADETAKVNLNRVAADRGRGGVRHAVSALGEGRWSLQVVLRPRAPPKGVIRTPPVRYASLEQVFAAPAPGDLLGGGRSGPAPSDRLTCWGGGKVHLRRATAPVLREMLLGLLTHYQVQRLAALREEEPSLGVEGLLDRLDLEEKKRGAARRRLTVRSTCHSLWIVTRGRTRDWYRLAVRQQAGAENDAGRWTFVW